MKQLDDETLKTNIKKNIYSKAQTAKIIFPAGLGKIALEEAKTILSHLWLAKKFTGEIRLLKNEIQIRPIYMLAIYELLLRNYCFTDVRLVIFKDTVIGKKAFEKKCRDIPWNLYINHAMDIKIKVSSVSSTAFHETGLKEILTEILKPHVNRVVTGEHAHETTCLHAELYKEKLTISISLSGEPLYKRGYREILSASAPLREDAAASCIQNALHFAKTLNPSYAPKIVLIPFSGTGTFCFEFIHTFFHWIPALFYRKYALQTMPLFRESHFSLLIKNAIDQSKYQNLHLVCIDPSSQAHATLDKNIQNIKKITDELDFMLPVIDNIKEDFFKSKLETLSGDIFIPLNPPYGIRLQKDANSILLYKKIAFKMNEIFMLARKNKSNITGLILCPSEETWSAFYNHLKEAKTETYHFTQGGLDIRVCQFYA